MLLRQTNNKNQTNPVFYWHLYRLSSSPEVFALNNAKYIVTKLISKSTVQNVNCRFISKPFVYAESKTVDGSFMIIMGSVPTFYYCRIWINLYKKNIDFITIQKVSLKYSRLPRLHCRNYPTPHQMHPQKVPLL